jgi:hypothetical protein
MGETLPERDPFEQRKSTFKLDFLPAAARRHETTPQPIGPWK